MAGEMDMDNAAAVEHQILDAISNQLTAVTLDLSGLDYIDSAGLRVLFTSAPAWKPSRSLCSSLSPASHRSAE